MEFRILGPLEVSGADGHLPITAAMHRALLLHLLVHANETISADALVEALWGARPPASARKLIQVYVSQLRKLLGDSVLETRPVPGMSEATERDARAALSAGRSSFLTLLRPADGSTWAAAARPTDLVLGLSIGRYDLRLERV